jgi:hypothetical protein
MAKQLLLGPCGAVCRHFIRPWASVCGKVLFVQVAIESFLTKVLRSNCCLKNYAGQFVVDKRPPTNGGDARWDGNAGQLVIAKRIVTNGSNTVWDGKAGQLVVLKRMVINRGNAIRNDNAGQVVAGKRTVTNGSDTRWDGNAGQFVAGKRTGPNGSNAVYELGKMTHFTQLQNASLV